MNHTRRTITPPPVQSDLFGCSKESDVQLIMFQLKTFKFFFIKQKKKHN